MKFNKVILSLAFAGAILGGAATTANADTVASYQQPQAGQTTTVNNRTYQSNATNNQAVTTTSQSSRSTTNSSAVVNLAKQLASQSIPYVWGGESLKGMDCSGLTDYVYQKAAGISLGHYTVTQESHVTKEAVSAAQPGDLLFWGSQGATYHVAIYIGNNQYVAAPQPGQNVQIQTINSAFMPSFAGHVNG